MYSLSCQELGITSCGFEEIGGNVIELKSAILSHVRDSHSKKFSNISAGEYDNFVRMMDNMLNAKMKI